jgi:hypothetical protein
MVLTLRNLVGIDPFLPWQSHLLRHNEKPIEFPVLRLRREG